MEKFTAICIIYVINFLVLLGTHWIFTNWFSINSVMAWIIAMFLMAIFEADQFLAKGL